jgi:hypothetical protein
MTPICTLTPDEAQQLADSLLEAIKHAFMSRKRLNKGHKRNEI